MPTATASKSSFTWLAVTGVVSLAILSLIAESSALTFGGAVLALVGIMLTPLVAFYPVWGATAYVGLLGLGCWHTEWRSLLLLVWSFMVVGILSYRRGWVWATIYGVVMMVLSMLDPHRNGEATFAPLPALFLGSLYVVSTIVGMSVRRSAAEKRALKAQAQRQRQALATALHDSVAATLTSVVMRSEALALRSGGEGSVADNATAIAEDARQAMGEVRELLRVMKDENHQLRPSGEFYLPQEIYAVGTGLEELGAYLRSHGFVCTPRLSLSPKLAARAVPTDIGQIFTELAANLIKYAQPHSTIGLMAIEREDTIHIELRSTTASAQPPRYLSTEIGLEDIAKRIAHVGGSYQGGPQGKMWVTRIQLPHSALRRGR
ncbi:hypothetical protein G7Y31_05695 [Corynebacterium lizhenjunii]|uniref:histidine kinase n=1 Tax=Corynebacterium lizhenjunii TaxID=2709394 RepID=A0A7T0KGL1_9CORY|nr:histidine kinase [Corynebacterium lizhenjunii]QPK80167.1 hypothetical protein G7Y31_05695 [Corynebacterium lizhenjunii]